MDNGSGEQAIVIGAEDGDSTLYFAPINGGTILDTETLTGAVSGASATLSSSPAAAGFMYRPNSASFEALSLRVEEDGYLKKLRGCMGTASISIESSQRGLIEFEFQGAIEDFGDGALTSGISYYTTVPPTLVNADARLDDGTVGAYAPVFTTFGLDMGNEVVIRRDANASDGVKTAMITGRAPTASFDPEMVLTTTYDFFDKYFNGTPVTLQQKLGSTAGNIVEIYVGNAQFNGLGDGERDGIATIDAGLNLKRVGGDGDDEYLIVFR